VASPVDRAMFGYFASKRIVEDSGVPWTTRRATRFHEMILMVAQQMARFQPVDAGEVAAKLADLALGTPKGLVADMAGPKVYSAAGLLRRYLRATH
jgi:uncharacterized protein YbjT (DUF2867 family)